MTLVLTCQRCGQEIERADWTDASLCVSCSVVNDCAMYASEVTRLLRKRDRYAGRGISVAPINQQLMALVLRIQRKEANRYPGSSRVTAGIEAFLNQCEASARGFKKLVAK